MWQLLKGEIVTESTKYLDSKQRFAFGKNWSRFLKYLNEDRINEAEKSLQEKLGCSTLKDKIFLDIGCGSGLFSLAAHRLEATVYSFDYDIDSVNCTKHLKETYGNENTTWSIEQGSVLDQDFLKKFELVDIVYSWGVLHHTGNMQQALNNVSNLVKPNARLFISIYNNQGLTSKVWRKIKKCYTNIPISRPFLVTFCGLWLWKYNFAFGLIRHGNPLKFWLNYGNNRGMSAWHDLIDWVGGYPFEVAKPEEIFDFFKTKNFELQRLKTCAGGLGCNEFVFIKK